MDTKAREHYINILKWRLEQGVAEQTKVAVNNQRVRNQIRKLEKLDEHLDKHD